MTVDVSRSRAAHAPRHLFTVALLGAAGLAAWAAYLSAHAAVLHPLQAMARTEQRVAHEVRSRLAKEYDSVHPADADSRPPPIPPSETWPAQ